MPSHALYWEGHIAAAQRAFLDFARVLCARGGESVHILYDGAAVGEMLGAELSDAPGLQLHALPLGDIWLRDTAPLFVNTADGVQAQCFANNGWGGKYVMPHDDTLGLRIAERCGCTFAQWPLVLEGGSLDVDGIGTGLSTRQCLLNPNRNPTLRQGDIEALLAETLGIEDLIWIEHGLENDHTDGHIDNIARFVAIGKVVAQRPSGRDDPNAATLKSILKALNRARDHRGRQLEVIEIPSPGLVQGADGAVMPASHVNFYIANRAVYVPVYDGAEQAAALAGIADCFPERAVIPVPARGLLHGGGALHCITQQQPAAQPDASA